MRERCCPRGSAAPRAPSRAVQRCTGSRATAALSLPPSRSTQRSGLGHLPSSSLPAAPRPETTPRGSPQPHSRTAVPRRRCSAPGASGRFLGQRLRGRLLRPLLGAGLGSPRPDRSPRRRENEIEVNPGPTDGDAAAAGLRTAVPTRRLAEAGLSVPARGNAARRAHPERRPVLRSKIAEARHCHGCSARGRRCGGRIAPVTDRPARETFAPRPPAPPRPREEPAEPRARGSRSAPGPPPPKGPPAASRLSLTHRLLPAPAAAAYEPLPADVPALRWHNPRRRWGRARAAPRPPGAAPRCGEERGTRGAPALLRGGGWLYPPGRAVPPLRGAATSFPAPGRRSRTAAGPGVMAPPGGRAKQRHAGGGGPRAGAAERGYGRRVAGRLF